MAIQNKADSDKTELSTLYQTIDIQAKGNLVGENLKKAINEHLSGKIPDNILSGDDKNSPNRKTRRKIKRAIRQAIDSDSISLLYPVCCGVDVHKDVIVACLRTMSKDGKIIKEIREFSGFTDDLIVMRKWLQDNNCPIVAMESTGVYWRPLHNILEDHTNVILVNARHFKNVPGRKTDVSDSKWLAELLQYGLLKGSFIPSKEVRDWRELARNRRKITKDLGDYKRRVHKVFETANIKIDSVASDLFGVTSRSLIDYLCNSKEITLEGVEQRAKGKLKKKSSELYRSLQGFFREHHRFEILGFLKIISCLEEQIAANTARLKLLMGDHDELSSRLIDIPGIQQVSAQAILAELGSDLSEFANENVLSAWAGVAPGNNQSAGKRYSGKSPVRKHPLKEALIEVAWAAIKKKGSFYKDKYYRLKARRGAKKAIVAIAHRILKAIYFIIKHGATFKELGEGYLKERRRKTKMSYIIQQAKELGFELKPAC